MDWIFLAKTVVSLIFIFCGTWYLRRNEKDRYAFGTFLLVTLLVFSAVIAGTVATSRVELQNDKVRITALNKRNADSKENTIYLTGVYADKKKIKIQRVTDEAWQWKDNWYVWRAQGGGKNPLPRCIELKIPVVKNRRIDFLANTHKGLVKVEYEGTVQVVDCYSPQKKTVSVSLKNPSYERIRKVVLMELGLCMLLTAVLSLFFIVVTDRLWRGKLCLPLSDAFQSPVTYDKDDALALKGIAILVMLMHHLFLAGRFDAGTISFAPFSASNISQFANYCKICVSMFAFMSGYGLFLSYRKNQLSDKQWVALRYLKTFSGFWVIVVLSWIVCQVINGRVYTVYFGKNIGTGIVSMFLDFMGLSNLFGTGTLIGTWWYMSAALVFILLTPLVAHRNGKNLVFYCFVACVFVRIIAGGNLNHFYGGNWIGRTPYSFLLAFLMGALFAKNDILVRLANASARWLRIIVEIVLIFLSYKLYIDFSTQTFFDVKWGLLPLFFIVFCVEFVIPRKGVRQFLVFLGRHSMNIFLTHTFIRGIYFSNFIYSFHHFIIIYLVLLFTSLVLSVLIEQIKKVLKYDEFIDSLCERITGHL